MVLPCVAPDARAMLSDDREAAIDILCNLGAGGCLCILVERRIEKGRLLQQGLGALVQASRRQSDRGFEFLLTHALLRRHSDSSCQLVGSGAFLSTSGGPT